MTHHPPLPPFFDYSALSVEALLKEQSSRFEPFAHFDHITPEPPSKIEAIVTLFERYEVKGTKEGFTPLLLRFDDALKERFEITLKESQCTTLREAAPLALKEAATIDAKAFLEESWPKEELLSERYLGKFSSDAPNNEPTMLSLLKEEQFKELLLVMVPTRDRAELPAYLPMGGFSEAPTPAEQIAIFKLWSESYPLTPFMINHDGWELKLDHPIQSEEEALNFATMHAQFCRNLIHQKEEKIRPFASRLIDAPYWLFWWR